MLYFCKLFKWVELPSGCVVPGLAHFGQNAEELCLNLYYFFKKSPCTKYELYDIEEKLGLNELLVLCHVQS